MEPEFVAGKKKKSVLWGKVLVKMKEVNPEITQSKEVIQRKFLNLLASYKRIKKRNNSTGRDATTWDFYDDFDNVYGRRHSIQPPEQNLQSSLPGLSEINVNENESDSDGRDFETSVASTPRKRSKPSANETLVFFKEEAANEQKRHEEVLKLEKEKLEIEKEKIKAMEELRKVLEMRTRN
ncbi:PREDICTED: uncharacterized protein LOC108382471 [Rhagoletis zephyria]|uniref:uncharacterized protein LOC108382471 n=1 Tax=Rhagoletis zephyria TaxID=28612 RepID=UPI0008116FF6|nr:PREDICTED: uncharacterized protein LOC108382471 [Rhagoletis zephyria]XP_036329227.1 uncharacterized protein LOC118741382 [Rhagoletis pomonella]